MANEEDEGIEEYVNVIIFGGIYGIMMILIIGHVFVRWQLRRKSLTKWKARTPGGSSFRNKNVRQHIIEDFSAIRDLTSDPRLIDDSLPPNAFGSSKDEDHPPVHWFRMKAFDCAADFVASYLYLLKKGNSLPTTNTFPQFLNFLLQKNVLPMEAEDIVSVTIKAYKNARYNIGKFSMDDFSKFNQLLAQLEHILSNGSSLEQKIRHSTIEPIGGNPSASSRDKSRYSQEPLLDLEQQHFLSDGDKKISSEETDVLRSLSHSSSKRPKKPSDLQKTAGNRPVSLEIPLIDSQASTPLGSTSSPFFSRAAVQS